LNHEKIGGLGRDECPKVKMGSLEPLEFIVAAEDVGRLDLFLARRLARGGPSRSQIKAWIERGGVTVSGRMVTKAGTLLSVGDVVEVMAPAAAPVGLPPLELPLDIVYEDTSLIVLNKPAGLTMHPGAGNREHTLVNALIAHFRGGAAPELFSTEASGRPGIVHRLDRDTTGLVVVAKTTAALHALSRQFAARTVGRSYCALVLSTPRGLRAVNTADAGTIDRPIGRHPTKRTLMAIAAQGRRAVTHWRALERFAYGTLLEARLETGRTHQIRVHLESIGCPVIGDQTYGDFSALPPSLRRAAERFGRQALHAQTLEFDHPVTRARLSFSGPPPSDFMALLEAFRTGGMLV
jgi:23S rRNA pseudouridine1911/1915/1917 synthase